MHLEYLNEKTVTRITMSRIDMCEEYLAENEPLEPIGDILYICIQENIRPEYHNTYVFMQLRIFRPIAIFFVRSQFCTHFPPFCSFHCVTSI